MLEGSIKNREKKKKKNEMVTILQNFLLALDFVMSNLFIKQKGRHLQPLFD